MKSSRKFCTCQTKKSPQSFDHESGCDYHRQRPETKDEKIARLEKEAHESSASDMLLSLILTRKAEPVEVSVETYDDPPQVVTAKVWPQRKDDGIVWAEGRAHWLGSWAAAMNASHHYYLRDLASKANAVYEKHWSAKS
jgi:hypothetical protein